MKRPFISMNKRGETVYVRGRYVGGYVIIDDPDAPSGRIEYETFQCCHCNRHYRREAGQGPPAMCLRCNQPTCGKKPCDPCIPFEAKLEAMEGRRRFWKQLEV